MIDIHKQPILMVKNLTVVFKTKSGVKKILDDVSFCLFEKQTLGIVGESGSGKTITAMSILNIVPRPPLLEISGEILFQGKNLLSFSEKEIRRVRGDRIAYIFQEPMTALNPVLTIGDQIVETILAHQALDKKSARQKAEKLLREVGIPNPGERLSAYPHQMSGGMRQRAMIAMALSCDPEILIADEPTTALDVTIQAQVLDLFSHLTQSRGMAIIFVTHDLGVIAEIADDVLVLRDGKMIEKKAVREIFEAPEHDYTRELLRLLKGDSI